MASQDGSDPSRKLPTVIVTRRERRPRRWAGCAGMPWAGNRWPWMTAQTIKSPERMALMMAPGFASSGGDHRNDFR